MAITAANLTSGGTTTNATSFATASVSPGANRLILVAVDCTPDSGAAAPTVTGNGLTYVLIDGGEYGGPGAGRDVWLFRAMGASPSAGAITINFGAVSQASINWSVDEFDGVDTSGTNGSGAIVQSVKTLPAANAVGIAITLAAFGSTNNFAYMACSHGANETWTVGSGFTALANRSIGSPSLGFLTEYQQNDNICDASYATSTTRGGVAVEIKAASGVTETPTPGGVTVGGTGPVALAAVIAAGVTVGGITPSPVAPVTAAGVIVGGFDATAAATATPTPGGVVAGGQGPSALVPVSAGGSTISGTGPTTVVIVGTGGVIVGGNAPTENSSTIETPTPGGIVINGTGPTARVTTSAGGVIVGGLSPTPAASVAAGGVTSAAGSPRAVVTVSPGGVVVGGVAPTEGSLIVVLTQPFDSLRPPTTRLARSSSRSTGFDALRPIRQGD